jgi:hypothetical protein
VASYIVPKQEDLSIPTLRHPDLHQSNIFLCPRSKKIISVIDWQGAAILLFFVQSGYPALCEHEPGRPQSLEEPKLSDDFDKLDPEEQQKAMKKLKHEQANLYYTAATALQCERHLQALRLPHLEMRQYLIKQAGMPWDGDLVNLRVALIGICSKWHDLFGDTPCPISTTDEEVQIATRESKEWNEAAEVLATVRESLDIDGEGGTDPANYSRACSLNWEWRVQKLRGSKKEERQRCWEIWPYKDSEGDSEMPVLESTENHEN